MQKLVNSISFCFRVENFYKLILRKLGGCKDVDKCCMSVWVIKIQKLSSIFIITLVREVYGIIDLYIIYHILVREVRVKIQ